jgi:uncharacterized protein
MLFEWDLAKEQTNIAKHGLTFTEAAQMFQSNHFTRQDKRHDYGEARFISIGQIGDAVIVVVVHTPRRDVIRIISARHASFKERQKYHDDCANQSL